MTDRMIELPLEFGPPSSSKVRAAIEALANASGAESRGAIFTRSEVVEFILDLAGYVESRPLYDLRLLEPSFGGGDFLEPIISRLVASWRKAKRRGSIVEGLRSSLRAVELHRATFLETREKVIAQLRKLRVPEGAAIELADAWLHQGDFLLMHLDGEFNFVVGNPPYVRQEMIPNDLLHEYRNRFRTMYDRADLYIPFFEKSLSLLAPNGSFVFICADRWMKNRYGGPLRELISSRFHLRAYVDMTNTPAFHVDVVAYPAITVITKATPGPTRVAKQPRIEASELSSLARSLLQTEEPLEPGRVREVSRVANGSAPWLMEGSEKTDLIRRLEAEFLSIEDAGCKIGIGVATGADKAFIGDFDKLDVEPDRKLRLVTTRDINSGEVEWRGLGVINPFQDEGGLVDLSKYPRLKRYLEDRREVIAGRHCAQKDAKNWYRTIDRITPSLASKPKLLIPDIKGESHIVFEGGRLYPHHNLYFVTSETWDLRALQAVLLSSVTRMFVATYSTKMRGGFLRFQAQYLRRIRLPRWETVPDQLRRELREAAEERDFKACDKAVFKLYRISKEEQRSLKDR